MADPKGSANFISESNKFLRKNHKNIINYKIGYVYDDFYDWSSSMMASVGKNFTVFDYFTRNEGKKVYEKEHT